MTACAAEIPWPPRDGSCVEAYKRPGRRRPWQYWIAGRSATHDEVARTVYDDTLRAKVRRNERIVTAVPFLIVPGQAATVTGIGLAAANRQPFFALLTLGGLALTATAVALLATADDPFRRAVVAFNADAQRRGVCAGNTVRVSPRPPEVPAPPPDLPAGPPPPPAPRDGMPVVPSRGWTP